MKQLTSPLQKEVNTEEKINFESPTKIRIDFRFDSFDENYNDMCRTVQTRRNFYD